MTTEKDICPQLFCLSSSYCREPHTQGKQPSQEKPPLWRYPLVGSLKHFFSNRSVLKWLGFYSNQFCCKSIVIRQLKTFVTLSMRKWVQVSNKCFRKDLLGAQLFFARIELPTFWSSFLSLSVDVDEDSLRGKIKSSSSCRFMHSQIPRLVFAALISWERKEKSAPSC